MRYFPFPKLGRGHEFPVDDKGRINFNSDQDGVEFEMDWAMEEWRRDEFFLHS